MDLHPVMAMAIIIPRLLPHLGMVITIDITMLG